MYVGAGFQMRMYSYLPSIVRVSMFVFWEFVVLWRFTLDELDIGSIWNRSIARVMKRVCFWDELVEMMLGNGQ